MSTVRRRDVLLATPVWLVPAIGGAQSAPVKIVATIAVEGAFSELEPLLPAGAGVQVQIEFATTAALVERLMGGETADIAVLTKEAVQRLTASGHVRAATDLVLSLIGIAVADDAPPPVMSTTEDFVAFLKATPSIAYTARGVSGVHMAQLIERHGLAEVVRPKAIIVDGFSGPLLKEGRVAAAVQQISELKYTGATNIVPLPDDIQVRTIFTVAVLNSAAHADSATSVVRALTSREAAQVYERSGAAPLFE
jgi:molybdate transport system substrate-binding protein